MWLIHTLAAELGCQPLPSGHHVSTQNISRRKNTYTKSNTQYADKSTVKHFALTTCTEFLHTKSDIHLHCLR